MASWILVFIKKNASSLTGKYIFLISQNTLLPLQKIFSTSDFIPENCCSLTVANMQQDHRKLFLKPIIRLMFNKEEHLFVRPEPQLPQNE